MRYFPVAGIIVLSLFVTGSPARSDLLSDYLLYPDRPALQHDIDRINRYNERLSQQKPQVRLWFYTSGHKSGSLEYYRKKLIPSQSNIPHKHRVIVLHLTGNAGQAHLGSPWQSLYPLNWEVEEWSFSYPGFGASEGKPKVKAIPAFAETAFRLVRGHVNQQQKTASQKIRFLISGYSLGSAPALYLSRKFSADGLLLYNAPVFPEILHTHVKIAAGGFLKAISSPLIWWAFPSQLKTLNNAEKCEIPAVIISGGQDNIALPENQEKLVKHYKGPWVRHLIPHMGHEPDSVETGFSRESIRKSMQKLIFRKNF